MRKANVCVAEVVFKLTIYIILPKHPVVSTMASAYIE